MSTAYAQTTFEDKQVISATFFSGATPVLDGQINPDEWSRASNSPSVEWEVVATKNAEGYHVEFRIALESIEVIDGPDETRAPELGDYIGFNVGVIEPTGVQEPTAPAIRTVR